MPEAFDIAEDITHQRKVWKLERCAWVLMTLAIVAALGGFAGHGPFSARTVAVPESGLLVEYQRFGRYDTQSQLGLLLMGTPAGETRIHINEEFLGGVEITRIEPEPVRAELDVDSTAYVFDTTGAGRIVLYYRPVDAGSLQLVLARDDAPPLYLAQFVYP